MIDVILSEFARTMLRAASTSPTFKETGHRNEKGEWVEPMAEETVERLMAHALPGETPGDVIERLIVSKKN